MLTTRRANVTVVGAGIAGLTLATRLKQDNQNATVVLIGPEDRRPQRISTWLDGKQEVPAVVESCIDKQWDAWVFRDSAGTPHTQRASTWHYNAIDGRRLKTQLEEGVELLGVHRVHEQCHGVNRTAVGYQILCDSETIFSDHLVDTRPPTIPSTTIKQQFVGHTIRCANPHQYSAPLLMDFSASSIANDGLTFIYCLPVSDHELLVEATTFSPSLHAHADYEACINQWLTTNLPTNAYKHIETESGILPMGPTKPIDATLVRCGIAGGAARASTGYAWHGTHRQISKLTTAFSRTGGLSSVQAYSDRARLMDILFLRVLRHQPEAAHNLFIAMAQHLPGDTLAQFLCDEGGWGPCLHTIIAAPKWPFIHALWRT